MPYLLPARGQVGEGSFGPLFKASTQTRYINAIQLDALCIERTLDDIAKQADKVSKFLDFDTLLAAMDESNPFRASILNHRELSHLTSCAVRIGREG